MQTLVLGIDGLGGAGKTTVAERIQLEFVDSVLLHIDDFIHPKSIRYAEGLEPWKAYYFEQWRYSYLIGEILEPIRKGKPVHKKIEVYNKINDSYDEKWIDLPVGGMLLIEGVFLQRAELRDYFDHVIFIDIDKEIRLQRVLERDSYIGSQQEILNKYNDRYFPAEEEYIRENNPVILADFVINGTSQTKRFHDYLRSIAGIL